MFKKQISKKINKKILSTLLYRKSLKVNYFNVVHLIFTQPVQCTPCIVRQTSKLFSFLPHSNHLICEYWLQQLDVSKEAFKKI